ncbi:group II intron maturase-specific domain-containing protein [Streptomyces sp. M19]
MRVRLSGLHRAVARGQAGHQAEQGSVQQTPETAADGHARPAGGPAGAVIRTFNPVVKGWSAYYRSAASFRVFCSMDFYMFTLLYKWAKYSHQNRSGLWIKRHYFGRFNKSRRDNWVFGDHASGAYLQKFAWTRYTRHVPVKGRRLRTTRP